ncbi:MAG: hypothetical protein Q4C81_05260 [Kocuria sp.]|nr:hypothetical protein [Kocuria sp.]
MAKPGLNDSDMGFQTFVPYEPPPLRPLDARICDKNLEPTFIQWRVKGKFVQADASSNELLSINKMTLPSENYLRIFLSDLRISSEVHLRVFQSVGPDGYPARGDLGEEYKCGHSEVPEFNHCRINFNEYGSGIVRIKGENFAQTTSKFIVVEIRYPTLEESDINESIPSYSVSWAFKV